MRPPIVDVVHSMELNFAISRRAVGNSLTTRDPRRRAQPEPCTASNLLTGARWILRAVQWEAATRHEDLRRTTSLGFTGCRQTARLLRHTARGRKGKVGDLNSSPASARGGSGPVAPRFATNGMISRQWSRASTVSWQVSLSWGGSAKHLGRSEGQGLFDGRLHQICTTGPTQPESTY